MKTGSLGHSKAALSSPGFPDYQRNFSAQVELYKKLAKDAWHSPPPDEGKRQDRNIALFKELGGALESELEDFSKADFAKPDEALIGRVNSLALFMWLFDKVLELNGAVQKMNKAGLFSLNDSARNSVRKLLAAKYFKRPFAEVLGEYLLIEPLLAACAELCGVEMLPIQEIVRLYQPKLAERVRQAQNKAAQSGKKD